MRVPSGIKHFQHILEKAATIAMIGGRKVTVIKATPRALEMPNMP